MVIVGDFDVATMEEKIKAKFAEWTGEGENPARSLIFPMR